MAKAYSLDLRQKILSAWQNQESSQRGLAERFKVSLAFVAKLLRQYLREIQGEILRKTGIQVSTSSLCRQLQKLELGRKKKSNCQ